MKRADWLRPLLELLEGQAKRAGQAGLSSGQKALAAHLFEVIINEVSLPIKPCHLSKLCRLKRFKVSPTHACRCPSFWKHPPGRRSTSLHAARPLHTAAAVQSQHARIRCELCCPHMVLDLLQLMSWCFLALHDSAYLVTRMLPTVQRAAPLAAAAAAAEVALKPVCNAVGAGRDAR